MAENKMCPHCGSKMFMAAITRACVVEVLAPEKDTDNNTYTILKENKDSYNINIAKCARCKVEVEETELVAGVVCKECGKMTVPSEVDENGICNVCTAVRQRSELANASKEDLIRMLLEAEKRANPVATRMEKQIEKATETESEASDSSTPVVAESSDTTDKPEKQRRAKRKKKTTDDTQDDANPCVEDSEEDIETEPEVTETSESNEAVDIIANQQEAPFPEMNLPESPLQEPELVPEQPEVSNVNEQPIGAGFSMFDDGEEPF